MNVNNSLTQSKANKPAPFSQVINGEKYQAMINRTLKDPNKVQRFVSSIVSAVSVNPALQECASDTILSGALLGESLGLSPSPQLGQYYLVPYDDKKRECKVATFQLGYKGYVQLAERSGNYKKINVLSIKEGELVNFDPLNEDIEVTLIEDEEERENAPTIGYYAMFEYLNGFRKAIYWSKNKMLRHADKYSAAFTLNGDRYKVSYADYEAGKVQKKDAWRYSSFWYKDFDGMAHKTMLRQLISKWGIMSIEMQRAYEGDMAAIDADGTPNYIDNPNDAVINVSDITESVPDVVEAEPAETVVNDMQVTEDGEVIEPDNDVQEAFFGQ